MKAPNAVCRSCSLPRAMARRSRSRPAWRLGWDAAAFAAVMIVPRSLGRKLFLLAVRPFSRSQRTCRRPQVHGRGSRPTKMIACVNGQVGVRLSLVADVGSSALLTLIRKTHLVRRHTSRSLGRLSGAQPQSARSRFSSCCVLGSRSSRDVQVEERRRVKRLAGSKSTLPLMVLTNGLRYLSRTHRARLAVGNVRLLGSSTVPRSLTGRRILTQVRHRLCSATELAGTPRVASTMSLHTPPRISVAAFFTRSARALSRTADWCAADRNPNRT